MQNWKRTLSKNLWHFLLVCLPVTVQAQKNTHKTDSVTGNQINFYNSDLRNTKIVVGDQYNYLGLDSVQLKRLDTFNVKIKQLSFQMEKYSAQLGKNEAYGDSVLRLVKDMGNYQRKINELQHFNDSVLETKKGDEIVKQKLIDQYNRRLMAVWSDFWEKNPDFDPIGNGNCVKFLEKTRGETYGNRWHTGSVNSPTFSSCNECVRKFPGEWEGITVNGVACNFGTPEYDSLTIHIPQHGPITIGTLRIIYKEYWNLKNNRHEFVEKPFEVYLENKKHQDKSSENKNIRNNNESSSSSSSEEECRNNTGLMVYNEISEEIHVTVRGRKDNDYFIVLPGKSYKTNLLEGRYTLYVYRKPGADNVLRDVIKIDRIKIIKCQLSDIYMSH